MGPYERGSGVTPMERGDPAVCNVSFNREGKDEMIKASIDLQDLRRRLYVKAKAETSWRFWGCTSMFARWKRYAKRMRWPKKTMVPPE